MKGFEIKTKIDKNNYKIAELMNPAQFTLNPEITKMLKENEELQAQCQHEFEKGQCIYCYKKEEK